MWTKTNRRQKNLHHFFSIQKCVCIYFSLIQTFKVEMFLVFGSKVIWRFEFFLFFLLLLPHFGLPAIPTNECFNNFTIKIIFVTLRVAANIQCYMGQVCHLLCSPTKKRDYKLAVCWLTGPDEEMTFQHLKVMLNNKSENISWVLDSP